METMTETNDSQPPKQAEQAKPATSPAAYLMVLLMGVYLGILFSKSEVAHWQRIHDMFLFREAHMYLIIVTAIVVAMFSMQVIKRFQIRSIEGKPIKYSPKPYHTGVVIGGMLFGAGWAITGACPGPIYAQIGGGQWMALFTLVGALLGMFSYAALKPKLPH
ncbi:putative inner membrane protein [Stieleria magnilauensis]|uniref:Inner membrane protein n=2 Tax=Stieleria magnilauensis TaxID=2527963 RepID=A0ABX5XQB1_9BACT|nr:putative inner membrane protein [Planctomycetes bacterium TBK1r]